MSDSSQEALDELAQARFQERLWAKDASLWKTDAANQAVIRNALGWLTVPDAMAAGLGSTRSAISEIQKGGFERAVVLGMGGSSLACEVFRTFFPAQSGFAALTILDSTNPDTIRAVEKSLDFKRTLFIVSSKSGSTIEPNCLLSYFYDKAAKAGGKPGERFIAITDPGTSMEKLARTLAFRKIFKNPADIGGRFSALSLFGLVPAGLMGVDLQALLQRTRDFIAREKAGMGAATALGAFMGGHARAGRDKMTLALGPEIGALDLWIEQLVAESTGKEGKGILPVVEPLGPVDSYGKDRTFVQINFAGKYDPASDRRLAELESAGHPVHRLELKDAYDLGAHLFLWEAATAAAGFLLKLNPFDQPNVQQAKDRTKELLLDLEKGALPAQAQDFQAGGLAAHADEGLLKELKASRSDHLSLKDVLGAHLGRIGPGDYCVILGYLDASPENAAALAAIRDRIRLLTAAPVMVSIGPRYLHSTGQLYKGGQPGGVFLQLSLPAAKLPIPGERYDFSTLHSAQARGDFTAMISARRRILRLDPGPAVAQPLKAVLNAVKELQPCPS